MNAHLDHQLMSLSLEHINVSTKNQKPPRKSQVPYLHESSQQQQQWGRD